MIQKAVRGVLAAVSIAAGFPLSFSLRSMLALLFGNAVGVAVSLLWIKPPGSEIAAIVWVALWSAVVLTFAAAHEARGMRGAVSTRKPDASR